MLKTEERTTVGFVAMKSVTDIHALYTLVFVHLVAVTDQLLIVHLNAVSPCIISELGQT